VTARRSAARSRHDLERLAGAMGGDLVAHVAKHVGRQDAPAPLRFVRVIGLSP